MKKITFVLAFFAFTTSVFAQTSKEAPNLSLNPQEAIELTVQPTTDFQSFHLNADNNVEIAGDYPLRAYYNQNYYFRFQMPDDKNVSVHLKFPDKNVRAGMACYRVYHDEFIPVSQASLTSSGQAFNIRDRYFEAGQQVLVRLWFSDALPNAQIELALKSTIPGSPAKNIVIDTTYTPDQLVNDVFMGGNTSTSNIVFTGDTISIGQYEGSISGTDFGQGLIMTSGDANLAPGPDEGTSEGYANDGASDPDLQALIPSYTVNDACVLEFDFVATDNYVNFDYIFASEEFPEFANTDYNDVFGFFLSGPGINGPYSDDAVNIALLPNGDPVTIDNVFNNQQYYEGSISGEGGEGWAYNNDMEYDGASIPLTAEAYLWQGETYHIKLAIGDAGDEIYDSGVLFKGSSFVTGNQATGRVYYDTDGNCTFDGNDVPLPGNMLYSDPGNYVAMTGGNGMYALPLNMGLSSVSLTAPPLYDILCPAAGYHEVEITTAGQEVPGNDFALTSDIECPLLHVNMSGYQFLSCETSPVLVEFSNEGSAAAENVTLEIALDSNLTLVSADNITYTDLGNNTYLFEAGDMGIFESDGFIIEVGVSCNAGVAGLTECLSAQVFADNQCDFQNPGIPEDTTSNTVWDHSGILVTGQCTGDSLACFTILNEGDPGNGDMDGPREYRIYANDSLVDVGTFQLIGQESTEICVPTQGFAIRLEADQHAAHPGNSQPQETIEDCGDDTGNSLGYVVTTPLDDYDFDTDIWCQEVLPPSGGKAGETQIMSVQPKGVTDNHYVSNDAILNYTLWFQNPTDTIVQNLSIRNLLPEHLDHQTLRITGASHDCNVSISKEGILTWMFRNIDLPAAENDEAGSKGFISYSIKQVPMTSDDYGTEIENQATLYFDKNAPVTTNISHLTFWNLVDIPTHVPDESKALSVVNVYPNPAHTKANFQLPEGEYNSLRFRMYDATGKLVREVSDINTSLFSVKLDMLSTGVYYYDIRENGQTIGQGKLMLE